MKRGDVFYANLDPTQGPETQKTAPWPPLSRRMVNTDMSVLTMQDRDMLARYMTLSLADRKTVCDVVAALAVAAAVKAR